MTIQSKISALSALSLIGCAAEPHIEPPPAWTAQQQHDAAVVVEPCGGSGALIGGGLVLTASHVACDVDVSSIIPVVGSRQPVRHLAWRDDSHDLALLSSDLQSPTAVLDTAEVGDAACAEVALPVRQRRCGHITRISSIGTAHGHVDLWLDIEAVPGNSGAALYDIGGHLIGVVTDGVNGIALASSVYDTLPR